MRTRSVCSSHKALSLSPFTNFSLPQESLYAYMRTSQSAHPSSIHTIHKLPLLKCKGIYTCSTVCPQDDLREACNCSRIKLWAGQAGNSGALAIWCIVCRGTWTYRWVQSLSSFYFSFCGEAQPAWGSGQGPLLPKSKYTHKPMMSYHINC